MFVGSQVAKNFEQLNVLVWQQDGLKKFCPGVRIEVPVISQRKDFMDYREFIISLGVMWERFRKLMAQRKLKFHL